MCACKVSNVKTTAYFDAPWVLVRLSEAEPHHFSLYFWRRRYVVNLSRGHFNRRLFFNNQYNLQLAQSPDLEGDGSLASVYHRACGHYNIN